MSRNPYAKSLGAKIFAPKVIQPKKGKGSYQRTKQVKVSGESNER